MKLISIKKELFEEFKKVDIEMLDKEKRPCVLVVRLIYKGKKRNFAIPLRSNISKSAPKNTYFRLPVRNSTKKNNRHGLHYIKMFPIKSNYYNPYRMYDKESIKLWEYINKNEKYIIEGCQKYLNEYETGKRYIYSTDLDKLIEILDLIDNAK